MSQLRAEKWKGSEGLHAIGDKLKLYYKALRLTFADLNVMNIP